MELSLSPEIYTSIKKSYFNILALFFGKEHIESKYVRCLVKWAVQLHLNPKDLMHATGDFDSMTFSEPLDRVARMEAIYHLVYMIYLDNVVEDIELEVATIYAVALGFRPHLVGELLKSIATAPFDGSSPHLMKAEIQEFLSLHDV